MANALTYITVLHDPSREEDSVTKPLQMPAGEYRRELQQLGEFFAAAAGGQKLCSVRVAHETGADKVLASQTITLTQANIANDDTVTIGGVVFTVKASPATESEWTKGADVTASAVAFVDCINAHSKFKGLFTATNVAGVITLTANFPGRLFNLVTFATSKGTAFAFGATTMAGGTGSQLMAARHYQAGVVGT